MFQHSRKLSLAAMLTLSISVFACSALVPGDSEYITYCSKVDDCPTQDDNRTQAICDADEGVCGVEWRNAIGCDPESQPMTAPFREAWDASQAGKSTYSMGADCEASGNLGNLGCPVKDGSCNAGLEVDDTGICQDPESLFTAVATQASNAGFDVQDQYCRWYFGALESGENPFVCNRNSKKCEPCEAGEDIEDGGCFVFYYQGERSTVYSDEGWNTNGKMNPITDAVFGPPLAEE